MSRTRKDAPHRIWVAKYAPHWADSVSLPPIGGIWAGRKAASRERNAVERMRVRNALAVGLEPTPPNLHEVGWMLH
jgi:hypothetical protein